MAKFSPAGDNLCLKGRAHAVLHPDSSGPFPFWDCPPPVCCGGRPSAWSTPRALQEQQGQGQWAPNGEGRRHTGVCWEVDGASSPGAPKNTVLCLKRALGPPTPALPHCLQLVPLCHMPVIFHYCPLLKRGSSVPRDHGLTQSTVVMTAEDTSVVMAAATLPAVQVTQQRGPGE